MCGRFTLISDATIIAEMFQVLEVPDLDPRYNIAPTQLAPIIRFDIQQACRRLDMFRWGLIPSWAKDPAIGAKMINARAETVAVKPSFRSAYEVSTYVNKPANDAIECTHRLGLFDE